MKFVKASEMMMRNRMRYLGHLMRREDTRIVKQALYLQPRPEWKMRRGKPRKTWIECMKEQLNINNNDIGRNRDLRKIWTSGNWMDLLKGATAEREEWARIVRGEVPAAETIIRHAATSLRAD